MLAAALLPMLLQVLPAAAPGQEPGAPHPGRLVVLNKSEATASLIDLATGEVVATLDTGDGPHEVAVHPDGRWAVAADYGGPQAGSTLSVLDLQEGKRARVIELGEAVRPHGLVFEPDGRSLWLTAEVKQQLWKVDFEKGEVLARATTGQRASHMVARHRSGRLFVANIGSDNVTPVEADGTVLDPIPTGAGAEGIAVTPDGRQLWVTNRAADTVSVIAPDTLKPLKELACASFPIRVAITPDSRLALVSCARSGEVAVYRTRDFALLGRIKIERSAADEGEERLFGDQFGESPVPIGIAIAADSQRAWVACAGADVIAELDLADRKVVRFLKAGKEPDGIAWVEVGP